jgi:hypothetical protein
MAQVAPQTAGGSLDGPAKQVMDGTTGMMVRQVPKYCFPQLRMNEYKVAQASPEHFTEETRNVWDEAHFKDAPQIMNMKEDTTIPCKICCLNKRETKINVTGNDGSEYFTMEKPMKLAIPIYCFLVCPEEITTKNNKGETIGRVVHDFRCVDETCLGKQWNKIEDASGAPLYYVENNICCNKNMFAPSFCCKEREFAIWDAAQQNQVGHYSNLFSCNIKRLCLPGMDQYKIKLPEGATAEQKALILSSMVLHEFMLFEKAEEDGGS